MDCLASGHIQSIPFKSLQWALPDCISSVSERFYFFQDETHWRFALLVCSHQFLYPSTQPYIVIFPLDSGLSISLLILQHHLFGSYVQPVYSCIYVRITPKCLSPSSLVLLSYSHNLFFFYIMIGTKTSFCLTHPPTLIPYQSPFYISILCIIIYLICFTSSPSAISN